MVRRVGRASAWSSLEGSKSRSRVDLSASSGRVGRDVTAGRNGVAAGLRGDILSVDLMIIVCVILFVMSFVLSRCDGKDSGVVTIGRQAGGAGFWSLEGVQRQ